MGERAGGRRQGRPPGQVWGSIQSSIAALPSPSERHACWRALRISPPHAALLHLFPYLRWPLLSALFGCLALSVQAAPMSTPDIERLFRQGQATLALQRADESLAAEPQNAGLRFLKGVMLSESGQGGAAIAVFEQLTQDFPELPEPYNNLAVLLAANGQLDAARAALETALRHDPAYRTAHENLGDVLSRLAQRAYEAAAVGRPAEPALQRKLRLVRELSGSTR
jgi:colicin import membrane protein